MIGVVAAGIAVELGLKKLWAAPEKSKLTSVWSLTEFPSPLVVATDLQGVSLPKATRLVTAGPLDVPRDGFAVRRNGEAKANFVVDAEAPRALLFLGAVRPGALAIWTVDEGLIERLRAEFNRLWARSTDYVEQVRVADLSQKANLTVATKGFVEGVIPYRGQYMVRLTDHGDAVGVLVDHEVPLQGTHVEVVGVVRTSGSGYPLVEAFEIKKTA